MDKFIEAVKCMANSLLGLFNSAKNVLPYQYKVIGEYDFDTINGILKKTFGDVKTVMVNDLTYHSYSLDDFKHWILKDKSDEALYVNEYFDCDDFAYVFFASTRKALPGIPIGVIYTQSNNTAHAFNFFLDENKKIWLYEPQNDLVFEKATGNAYFLMI